MPTFTGMADVVEETEDEWPERENQKTWYRTHSLSVIQYIDPISQVRRIAWDDWRGTYDIDGNTEVPRVPRVITELYWYMTEEEYEVFAPHDNTLDDPYWSDSDFGRRRVPFEIATPLAQEWVRMYGERRARMGFYDNTPINTLLRKREISTGGTIICYEDYREAMVTVGRAVPAQDVWWNGSGLGGLQAKHNGSK